VWRPSNLQAFAWRTFGDESVVYNGLTGNTHHLSLLGSEVFVTLCRHPAGIEMVDLVRDIADRVDFSDDGTLAASVERTLAELAELQLVSPVSA
jgi:hypothetical protein